MAKSTVSVRYINILFAIYMASLVACSLFFYYRINVLEHAFSLVNHTIDIKLKLEQTLSNLRDAETEQRGFLLTNDSFFLDHYNDAREKTYEKLKMVQALTDYSPQQKANAIVLSNLVARRFTALENVMEHTDFHSLQLEEKKSLLVNGKNIMDDVRAQVETMRGIENNMLQERQASKEEVVEMTPIYVLGVLVFSLVILVLCYIAMQKFQLRQANIWM